MSLEDVLKKLGRGPKRECINKALIQRKEVRKSFDHFDKEKKGYITGDQFKTVLENKISSNITQEEVNKMMEQSDKDGDGQIDFEEFLKISTTFSRFRRLSSQDFEDFLKISTTFLRLYIYIYVYIRIYI